MLGKLTKHEFLTVSRLAIPAYLAILAISVVGRFLTWITSRQYVIDHVAPTFVRIIKILSSLISTVYVLAFIAFIVMTIAYLVYRFYKNYFTDEGYLMLTLPVKPAGLIFSKLFNSWIWLLFSAIVAVASLYITLGHYDQLTDLISRTFDSVKQVMEREGDFIRDELGVPIWVFVIELIIFVILLVSRYIFEWYASIGAGTMIAKKHKIIGTLIAFLILDNISYAVTGAFVAIATSVAPDYFTELSQSGGKALQLVVLGYSGVNLLLAGLLFWLLTYVMKHKLNLE